MPAFLFSCALLLLFRPHVRTKKVHPRMTLLKLRKALFSPSLVRGAGWYSSVCKIEECLVKILAVHYFVERPTHLHVAHAIDCVLFRKCSCKFFNPGIGNRIYDATPRHKSLPPSRRIAHSSRNDIVHSRLLFAADAAMPGNPATPQRLSIRAAKCLKSAHSATQRRDSLAAFPRSHVGSCNALLPKEQRAEKCSN